MGKNQVSCSFDSPGIIMPLPIDNEIWTAGRSDSPTHTNHITTSFAQDKIQIRLTMALYLFIYLFIHSFIHSFIHLLLNDAQGAAFPRQTG